MNTLETVFWVVVAGFIGLPLIIYYCVRMGTTAFYKAKKEYISSIMNKKGGGINGKNEGQSKEKSRS